MCPTLEAIAKPIIPQKTDPLIPTRVVSTRAVARVQPQPQTQNTDQPLTNRSEPAAESATTEESVKLSPQLSALARKEQAYRQREQALKDREKQVESDLDDARKYKELKAKLTVKDFSEAEALGLNYEEYTKYKVDKLNGENPQEQAIKKLEAEIEALKKGKEESAAQAYEDTVREYKKEISTLIETSSDFPSIKHLKREDAVLQLILDSWEQDGDEVTIAQAAKDIEEFLKEEAKQWAPLLKTPEATVVAEEKKTLPPPKPGLKTLTQQITTGSEKRPFKSLQQLSESERYAEARRRVLERREKGN